MDVALQRDRLTQAEAERRAGQVSAVSYDLHLDLEAGSKTYRGDCTIRFAFAGEEPTFLDFTGSVIERLSINGIDREPRWHDNRLALQPEWLDQANEVRVVYENTYDHSGEGFHQFIDPEDDAEYLYTQFEPFAAHRMFPCFDQPDLKATYAVAITAPAAWVVLSASRIVGEESEADGRVRRVYEQTAPFSTYLLSVVAGPYESVVAEHRGIPLGLYCRASFVEHLDADELFSFTTAGIDFFADFFGHPYPFTKYDQIFVPEFNWGGMENVANVTYSDRYLFRDPPTETQRLGRAEVFLHELAHQWFGDLVTMRWWNDVWLNESFATYMAYLGLERATEFSDGWQDFQADMKLWAMEEDQLPTTHRVADDIPSTDETFLNFDGITYGKGASALKQLVAAVGEDVFRAGVQSYFERFAFGNATLSDLLTAVAEGSGTDLHAWSNAWLEAPSLDTLAVRWEASGGMIDSMELVRTGPPGDDTVRPHMVDVAVVRDRGGMVAIESHRLSVEGGPVPVEGVVGSPTPLLVYPNHNDHTYAKVTLDPSSLQFAETRLEEITDPLLRQQLWTSLWQMVRDQQFSSLDYLKLVESKLLNEANTHIIKIITGTATSAIHRYVPEPDRVAESSRFVATAIQASHLAPPGDPRVHWVRALVRVAETPQDLAQSAALIDDPPDGLAIDQDMRWALAIRFTASGMEAAERRAAGEAQRDESDRGKRSLVTIETAVPEPDAKERAWGRIHGDGYGSLQLDRAAMAGFNWPNQADLLAPFVEPFFTGLAEVFDTREHEAAGAYFRSFYPTYRVDEEALRLARTTLAAVEGPPPLVRLLTEAIDRLERAISVRAFAAG
ncbi:MAG: aminopeptidase N [Acidimicrobiia bacterium]|nr:aminopeptidase N [Acidimicrobiia bacterium]